MTKIKIGGIVQYSGLTLIRFTSGASQANALAHLLEALGRADINVQFIVHNTDPAGNHQFALCISREDQEQTLAHLTRLQARDRFDSPHVETGVSSLGIYGPDFRIRPRLAGAFMGALDAAGIPIHAVSTSMSTFTVIIPAAMQAAAHSAIAEVFELP
jgi:aspartokinase